MLIFSGVYMCMQGVIMRAFAHIQRIPFKRLIFNTHPSPTACKSYLSNCACWNAHIHGLIYVHTQYKYAGIRTFPAQLVTALIFQRVLSYSIAPWASIIPATVRADMLIFSGIYMCMQGGDYASFRAHSQADLAAHFAYQHNWYGT
jgi:hypothetical protein